MRKSAIILVVCLTAFLIAVPTFSSDLESYQVVGIDDGDTIDVLSTPCGDNQIRYIGIDTPELGKDFYTESKKFNSRLVGEKVWVETDEELCGPYDRLLGYVYLSDDKRPSNMVNAILVAMGYAGEVYYVPNGKYRDLFVKLEETAKELNLGIWNGPLPNGNGNGDVAISCVHYDASGDDHENENGEWVVLKALEDVNIGGWTLSDEANHVFTFPGNYSLREGEKVKVYTGSRWDEKKDTGCGGEVEKQLYWGSDSAIWNNSGDTAYLKLNGEVISTCKYFGGGKQTSCPLD